MNRKYNWRFETGKSCTAFHNLGISVVKGIAKKYNDAIDIAYTNVKFAVTIFIRI